MKLNQTIAYAIAATAHIAAAPAGSPISNTAICKGTKMPDRYLLQVLRKLVTHGILVSTRGIAGGYKLAKPASKITLLEIVEAIDGRIGANGDVDVAGLSKESTATVEKALAAIEADARKRLAAITLADLRAAKAA